MLGDDVFYLCCGRREGDGAVPDLRLRGRSGHASDPHTADNALLKAGPVLEALGRLEPPQVAASRGRAFLEAVLGEVPPVEVALDRARALHPLAAELVAPLLSATLSPTMIEASRKRNVIPGSCTVEVDCRLLPGPGAARRSRRSLRAGSRANGRSSGSSPSTSAARDRRSTRRSGGRSRRGSSGVEPGARLAPIVCAGFTDSHYVRKAFGTTAYGFFPLQAMEAQLAARLVHSADERIAVDDLEAGVDLFRHVATTLSR